ncbi:unnamed protein product [marine sediment metagenome]|uniref:Uncharacterized protein n=1 Tax=marine sediment metagenome TaxID=412755 RepID=X0SRZ8_9ZZZZ
MNIEDLSLWEFNEDPYVGCRIQCPECEKWTHHVMWSESEVGCEDCGSHTALKCPACDERFGHVKGPIFKVI